MHRLSSVARHSKNSSKTINLTIINTQGDQAYRYPSPGRRKKAVSLSSLTPRMFTRNVSLTPQTLTRSYSNFHIHPEKLKQIMKERDGQNLCNYYDSDSYKMKAVDVVEEQSRIIHESIPRNLKEDVDVTYEHMLNCAQPRKKHKVFVVKEDKDEDIAKLPTEHKTLLNTFLRVKREGGSREDSTVEDRSKECKRRYRKRTTILPLYLKKIQGKQAASKEREVHDESENQAMRINLQITKSQYKVGDEKTAYNAQRLLKEKVLSVDYANEIAHRTKPPPKYTVGSEEERHWCQSPTMMQLHDPDGARKDSSSGKVK